MSYSQKEIATPKLNDYKCVKKQKVSATKRITYCATLVAAALLFKTLGNYLQFGSFKVTLVYVPWILCAIAMGPLAGALVSASTDIIGTLIASTGGAPLPLLVLSNMLFPIIVGVLFKVLPMKNIGLKLAIAAIVSSAICTMGISTYALAQLFEMPFWTQFVIRLAQLPVIFLNYILTFLLYRVLVKLKVF